MATKETKELAIDISGKTYTLFGCKSSTDDYYQKISLLADRVLEQERDIKAVIATLERASRKKRFLKKQLHTSGSRDPLVHFVLTQAQEILAPHTTLVKAHLQELSFLKRFDATLFTSEEQYHIYMLIIELANRAWGEAFRTAKRKVAFLPYCLRDSDCNVQVRPRRSGLCLQRVLKGLFREPREQAPQGRAGRALHLDERTPQIAAQGFKEPGRKHRGARRGLRSGAFPRHAALHGPRYPRGRDTLECEPLQALDGRVSSYFSGSGGLEEGGSGKAVNE